MPPISGIPAPAGMPGFRWLGNDRLGREDVLRDRRGVLERRARDHRRVDDPGLHEILELAGLDVEPVALGSRPDLVDDDRALEPRVVGKLTNWLLERAGDDDRTRPLVALERVGLDRLGRGQERDTAAWDDALLQRSESPAARPRRDASSPSSRSRSQRRP